MYLGIICATKVELKFVEEEFGDPYVEALSTAMIYQLCAECLDLTALVLVSNDTNKLPRGLFCSVYCAI